MKTINDETNGHLSMDYYKTKEKMLELYNACRDAKSAYLDAKYAFYEFSDGYQYYYCYKSKQALWGGGEGYRLVDGCPFCPKPQNKLALWEAEFGSGWECQSFVVFTDNSKFNFDSITEEHMVIYCDTEKLKEFKNRIQDEQLGGVLPEFVYVDYYLVKAPSDSYILRDERLYMNGDRTRTRINLR